MFISHAELNSKSRITIKKFQSLLLAMRLHTFSSCKMRSEIKLCFVIIPEVIFYKFAQKDIFGFLRVFDEKAEEVMRCISNS